MTRNVTEIQQRLIDMGFLAPRDEKGDRSDDGRFGERSMAAYNHFLASKGKPPHQGMILLAELNANLFPEEQPAPKPPKPKFTRKGNIMSNWFSSFVTTTAFKYLVAMAATFIATKLGLEKGSVEGLLTQLIAVAMGAWGMWEASRDKIVLDGKKVSVSHLDAADAKAVKEIVATNQ